MERRRPGRAQIAAVLVALATGLQRGAIGTSDWTRYEIDALVDANAKNVVWGMYRSRMRTTPVLFVEKTTAARKNPAP